MSLLQKNNNLAVLVLLQRSGEQDVRVPGTSGRGQRCLQDLVPHRHRQVSDVAHADRRIPHTTVRNVCIILDTPASLNFSLFFFFKVLLRQGHVICVCVCVFDLHGDNCYRALHIYTDFGDSSRSHESINYKSNIDSVAVQF